ncbi:MAG: hypothetical protein KGR98_09900 [Verrucomicrobia bacterium]|nr:hypothetical protein [Verrucomicrobiota bacterium]MDE3099751.1 hypothetical protein [Verrucomicrobiota bacterium]
MKCLAALVGLILAVAVLPARAQQDPDDQYIAIYNLMQQAGLLESAGQPAQALLEYRRADDDLQRFQKVFPGWNPAIVAYRLKYLAGKINGLIATLPAPSPTNAPSGLLSATNTPNAADASAAFAQVNALRQQVQNLQANNQDLQSKLKEALNAQPAAGENHELAFDRAQMDSLLKENDLLRVSARQRQQAPPPPNVKKLRNALDDATRKLREETDLANQLSAENRKLAARGKSMPPGNLPRLQDENASLNRKIAQLKSDAAVQQLQMLTLEKRLRQTEPPGRAPQQKSSVVSPSGPSDTGMAAQ